MMSQSVKRSQPLLSRILMISNSDWRRCNGNIGFSELNQTNGLIRNLTERRKHLRVKDQICIERVCWLEMELRDSSSLRCEVMKSLE